MSQFVSDLEDGKYDKESSDEPGSTESLKEGSVAPESGVAEETENAAKPEEDFGMGLEGEEEAADNAGDVKTDTNGKASYESKLSEKDEVSVMPEGEQVMIRTIPPDIGRVKLEAVSTLFSKPVLSSCSDTAAAKIRC